MAHQLIAPSLPKFLKAHPRVRLEFELTNRRVDVIGEGYDLAIRIRSTLEDSDLVIRHFGVSNQVLVASPGFIQEHGPLDSVEALDGVIGVGPAGVRGERPRWRMTLPDGSPAEVEYRPAFASDDAFLLSTLATAGVGVAQLPFHICAESLREGRLVRLLPKLQLPDHQLHAVFPTRRGMTPAVRAFVELLAADLTGSMARAHKEFQRSA